MPPSGYPDPIHLPANSQTTDFHFNGDRKEPGTRREIVTVTVARRDYKRLKAAGGPDPYFITMSLRHYVDLMRETGWRPQEASYGWEEGPVVNFLTAIPKDLAEEFRNLPGRFDGHTIEAVRLFLSDEPECLDDVSGEFGLLPVRWDSAFSFLAAFRSLVSLMVGFLFFRDRRGKTQA